MALDVCVIGAGRMGAVHAATIAALPGAHLVSIADPDLPRVTALAEELGTDATGDAHAAITSDAIDAVIVASPTEFHVEYIEAAAEAGKAIFCEKPIGMTLEEVERLHAEGHFPPGSMGPKIDAVIHFLHHGGKRALITDPDSLPRALEGRAGTHFLGQI